MIPSITFHPIKCYQPCLWGYASPPPSRRGIRIFVLILSSAEVRNIWISYAEKTSKCLHFAHRRNEETKERTRNEETKKRRDEEMKDWICKWWKRTKWRNAGMKKWRTKHEMKQMTKRRNDGMNKWRGDCVELVNGWMTNKIKVN